MAAQMKNLRGLLGIRRIDCFFIFFYLYPATAGQHTSCQERRDSRKEAKIQNKRIERKVFLLCSEVTGLATDKPSPLRTSYSCDSRQLQYLVTRDMP